MRATTSVGARMAALLLAGAAGVPARAPALELASLVPAGPMVCLEVEDVGDLHAALGDPTSRVGALLAGEGGRNFQVGKIPLKLEGRLHAWLDALLPEVPLAEVGARLLGGRALLAVYDLEYLRFAYALELGDESRLDELLTMARVPRRETTHDGVRVEQVGEGSGGFYLWRREGAVVLTNDAGLMEKGAALGASASLAAQGSYQRVGKGLPAGMLRVFAAPESFGTVYARSYWVGGSGAVPPPAAVGAVLRRLPGAGERYEEVRRRDQAQTRTPGGLEEAAALSPWLPGWTFREVGAVGAVAADTLLGQVVVAPETAAGKQAWSLLESQFSAWLQGASGYGLAGGLVDLPADDFAMGERPEHAFGDRWPPAEGLHARERAVVLLDYPDGAVPAQAAVEQALGAYLAAYLGRPEPPARGPDGLELPLTEDLAPRVAVLAPQVGSPRRVLLLATSKAAAVHAMSGAGAAFPGAARGAQRLVEVDGEALAQQGAWLERAALARAGWFPREQARFARVYLREPWARPLAGLRRIQASLGGPGDPSEDRVLYEFGP